MDMLQDLEDMQKVNVNIKVLAILLIACFNVAPEEEGQIPAQNQVSDQRKQSGR